MGLEVLACRIAGRSAALSPRPPDVGTRGAGPSTTGSATTPTGRRRGVPPASGRPFRATSSVALARLHASGGWAAATDIQSAYQPGPRSPPGRSRFTPEWI